MAHMFMFPFLLKAKGVHFDTLPLEGDLIMLNSLSGSSANYQTMHSLPNWQPRKGDIKYSRTRIYNTSPVKLN